MAKKKASSAGKAVSVEMLQLTVRVGTGGEDFFDFEIRADRNHNTAPPNAEFLAVKGGCDPKTMELLKEVLEKIGAQYGKGKIQLCAIGNRIVRDEFLKG